MGGGQEALQISRKGFSSIVSAHGARIGLGEEIDRLLDRGMEASPWAIPCADFGCVVGGALCRRLQVFEVRDVEHLLGESTPRYKLN